MESLQLSESHSPPSPAQVQEPKSIEHLRGICNWDYRGFEAASLHEELLTYVEIITTAADYTEPLYAELTSEQQELLIRKDFQRESEDDHKEIEKLIHFPKDCLFTYLKTRCDETKEAIEAQCSNLNALAKVLDKLLVKTEESKAKARQFRHRAVEIIYEGWGDLTHLGKALLALYDFAVSQHKLQSTGVRRQREATYGPRYPLILPSDPLPLGDPKRFPRTYEDYLRKVRERKKGLYTKDPVERDLSRHHHEDTATHALRARDVLSGHLGLRQSLTYRLSQGKVDHEV